MLVFPLFFVNVKVFWITPSYSCFVSTAIDSLLKVVGTWAAKLSITTFCAVGNFSHKLHFTSVSTSVFGLGFFVFVLRFSQPNNDNDIKEKINTFLNFLLICPPF